jgi:hypothetical protein
MKFKLMALENLPELPGRPRLWRTVATIIAVIGVTLGTVGAVKAGCTLVGVGCAIYSYNSYTSAQAKRKVELIIPMAACLVLIAMVYTLPQTH